MTARILIVEDERTAARSLQVLLEAMGHEVPALAATGADALRLAASERPDLVLMDINLHGPMDGVEAALLVRQRHGLPIVFLTGQGDQEVVERAKLAAPSGYLLKPFEERELAIVVEMALHRHRLERRLLERERLLSATLDAIGDAVLVSDPEGRATLLNPVAERLTGWSLAEAQGKPVAEVVAVAEGVLRRRDGAALRVEQSASPLLDDTGAALGGVLVFRDITERLRLEEHERQASKMEAIGTLAGGIAHEFNNLLTVINGYAGLAATGLEAKDPRREMLQKVERAGERASSLTSQLLAYSRRQILQPATVDLSALAQRAEAALARMLGESIELRLALAEGPCLAKADAANLEQAVVNLAANARDAMPEGGVLTLRTESAGGWSVLAVDDTGHGMDEATKARIFEPFFTTKPVGKGTGLGLAMVIGTVRQSGGTVEVDSAPGRGARFRLRFPAVAPAPAAPASADGAVAMPGGTERVLLVEDEAGVRQLTAMLLRRLGYAVLEAADGKEAEAHLGRGEAFDLLLCDLALPGNAGQETAARVREARPGCKVLFQSGWADQARVAGGAILQKPFTLAAMAAKVREVLDGTC